MPVLLFVVNDLGYFISHRLALAQSARAVGLEVHIATATGAAENIARLQAAGLHFHPLPLSRSGTGLIEQVIAFIAIYRLYQRIRPDIVHMVTIKPVLYGGIAARLTRIKAMVAAVPGLGYVFIAQGFGASLRRGLITWVYRIALRHPNLRVIFQNPDDLKRFVRASIIAARNARLIRGSGVDMGRFRCHTQRQGVPIIMFASRMLWDKGVGEFVAAAKSLNSRGVRARWLLVGDGDPANPKSVPVAQLHAWQVSGVVHWLGHCSDMPAMFNQSHIVCLPSYYGEGVPKVLIEAAACGRPIVTTDMPGCREIVHHGWNGILVPPRDVESLAEALDYLIRDPSLRRTMGRRGRQLAETQFAIEQVVGETLAVYGELLASTQDA